MKRLIHAFISLMICALFVFGLPDVHAQYVDFMHPFVVDDNTVLLMHFEGDLTNVSTLSEDGEPRGKIKFIQGLPNFGQAVWIDNNSPGVDTSMIVVPHSEALNLLTNFTIEGWSSNITFDGGAGTARSYHPWVLRKGTAGGGNDAHYGIMVNPFTHNFEATTVYPDFVDQIYCRLETDPGTVNLGEWYHFAFIKDFENKAIALLIHDSNGNLYQWATAFMPRDTTAHNDEPLYFGLRNLGHRDEGDFYWNGFLDEIRISDVVRNYNVPPVIGNVGLLFDGNNPKAYEDITVAAEVRMIGDNTLDGTPVLHYETGDGNWQEISMVPGDTSTVFLAVVPGQPKGTHVSYYITAKNQDGLEGRYPQKFGKYSAIGYWEVPATTLNITFEEGPPGPPQDYSGYNHQVLMLGDNLAYSNDVPPALKAESHYSLAINMDVDGEYPDTSCLMIPEPTPYINGGYDENGNYGWTVDFWFKPDTSVTYGTDINQGMMPIRTGILTNQTPGNLMHRFDILYDNSFNMRFYQYWAELNVPVPGLTDSGKWFHAVIGETQDIYFARFYDENDSLIAHGTVSKLQFEPYDPPYSTVPLLIGNSWRNTNDYRGWMDNIKWHNYPKDLPPTFYDIQIEGNPPVDQNMILKGTVTHPATEVANAKLHYLIMDGQSDWQVVDMIPENGDTYQAEIPAQPLGTIVQYYFSVEATNGLRSTYPDNAENQNEYLYNGWWNPRSLTLDLNFEEGMAGPITDHSVYNQTVKSFGNPQYSDDAYDGDYSLAFDGDSTYLEINPAPFFASKEFTVDFWFKADADIAKGVRFLLQEGDEWDEGPFHIQGRGKGVIRDETYIQTDAGIVRVRLELSKFETGHWYRHIFEVSKDSIYAELRDSTNTVIARQATSNDGYPVMKTGPFRLGAGKPDQAFTGKMDNVKIYNYSVSTPQTSVDSESGRLPLRFALLQNYPNPFNPSTNIQYVIPEASHVSLVIYDLLGRQVKTLVDKKQTPGKYSVVWDGKSQDGKQVATGVYFYRLTCKSGGTSKMMVKKLMLIH